VKPVSDYLQDIHDYIKDIESFTQTGEAEFMQDRKTQLAVIQAYQVIGEIVKRLPDDMLEQQPLVEWQKIKGFRDFLIHQYDNVDMSIVWDAVKQLPTLRAAVESMLADLPDDEA
jgi:uncharacterized protein with HEPN domain